MLIVVAAFLACWLAIARAPETATGRTLRRWLVDRPAGRLLRITRGDVATGIMLAFAAGMIAFVGEGDGLRILMVAAPDVAIWITTFEVATYVDVVMALVVAASSVRVRASLGHILTRVARTGRPRTTGRARRSRRSVGGTASNDDDGRHGVRLAA